MQGTSRRDIGICNYIYLCNLHIPAMNFIPLIPIRRKRFKIKLLMNVTKEVIGSTEIERNICSSCQIIRVTNYRLCRWRF